MKTNEDAERRRKLSFKIHKEPDTRPDNQTLVSHPLFINTMVGLSLVIGGWFFPSCLRMFTYSKTNSNSIRICIYTYTIHSYLTRK